MVATQSSTESYAFQPSIVRTACDGNGLGTERSPSTKKPTAFARVIVFALAESWK